MSAIQTTQQTVSADELFGRTRPPIKANRYGFIDTPHLTEVCASEFGELIAASISESSNLLDATHAQLSNISSNKNLTNAGKVAERDKIAATVAAKITELGNKRRHKLDQDLQHATAALPTGDLPGPKDPLEMMRQQEIRSYLRSKDPLDAEAIIMSAAAEGKWEIVAAGVHDPLSGLMKPSTRAKLTDNYHREKHPKAFDRIVACKEAMGAFEHNLKIACRSVGKLSSDDPLLQQAARAKPAPHDWVKDIAAAKK